MYLLSPGNIKGSGSVVIQAVKHFLLALIKGFLVKLVRHKLLKFKSLFPILTKSFQQ